MTDPLRNDIKIKDFGRDQKCRSVDALQSTLSEQYKGRHVSIVYPTKPFGLLRTIFVSVDEAGGVNQTYGDHAPVHFSTIEDDFLVKCEEMSR